MRKEKKSGDLKRTENGKEFKKEHKKTTTRKEGKNIPKGRSDYFKNPNNPPLDGAAEVEVDGTGPPETGAPKTGAPFSTKAAFSAI